MSEVRVVVEKQREALREGEEEREGLSQEVQAAAARERERREQEERERSEDTASLTVLQKQLTAVYNEK